MYMKVFAHGTGRGELATDYLVRTDYHNRDDKPPEVLRGDHELTADLINSIDRKWKYTAGVLSWHPEDAVTPEKEIELMNAFEKLAFAGLEPDQYNILWVRHTHANHHELHFVMPRMELYRGKAFNPCPPNWQKHFDPLRDYFNIKENWARPDDPKRQRLFTPDHADIKYNRLKRWGKEITKSETDKIRELLIGYIVKQIENATIRNRDDIIKSFQELDLKVPRQGKDYITVHDTESNKKIRFKGGIFHENWRLRTENSTAIKPRAEDIGADPASELERLRTELAEIYAKRSEYNRKQYSNHRRPLQSPLGNQLQSDNQVEALYLLYDNALLTRDNSRDILCDVHDERLHGEQNQQTSSRDSRTRKGRENMLRSAEKSTDLGHTDTRGEEWTFPYSSQRHESQNRLDIGRPRGNQVGITNTKPHNTKNTEVRQNIEHHIAHTNANHTPDTIQNIKDLAHERNTKIPRPDIQEHRTKYAEPPRQPTPRNQKNRGTTNRDDELEAKTQLPTNTQQQITEQARQLGAILERLDFVLQQITKLIPSIVRKNEPLNLFRWNKEKDNGISR